MADHYADKIKELEEERRKALRQAKRAAQRRREALRQRRWEDAREALRTSRVNRRDARGFLKRIRKLRGARKRANAVARVARHRRPVVGHAGFKWLDGKQLCGWIYDDLVRARQSGLWKGYVISGYRTPEYSRSLCIAMCGRPACPGRCAGVNTNHAKGPQYPLGATDVSDSQGLQRAERQLGLRLRHTLPYDLPHHSQTGQ